MSRLLVICQKVDKNDDHRGFFIGWLKALGKVFDEVSVVTLAEGAHELPANIRVYSLGKERGDSKLVQMVRFYKYLFELLPGSQGVFAHASPIFILASWPLACVYRKKTVLWYVHPKITLRLRMALLLADTILTVHPSSFPVPSRKVIAVGHGIDMDIFRQMDPLARIPRSLLFVGRIAPIKNLDVLIKACRILEERHIEFHLDIVGDVMERHREYYDMLIKKIHKYGLAEHVVMAKSVANRDMPGIYNGHQVLVNITPTGSFDKAVLEAMACGALVVTANRLFMTVVDAAFFCDGTNPRSVADAIGRALELDSTTAEVVRAKYRKYVSENHNLQILATRIRDLA